MFDRNVSSLRTLRPETEFDSSIFWFRDDLHQPYVISPMGMTTIQAHHAWGYHAAAANTSLPSSKGGHVKLYNGRVYLGFALIDDPEEIKEREPQFQELVEYCTDNWEQYYGDLISEVRNNLDEINSVNPDGLSLPDLLEHLERAESNNRRNWEIHFQLMYVADVIYFGFEEFCSDHGVDEKEMIRMLRGVEHMPSRTDEELWKLAQRAKETGVREAILETDQEDALSRIKEVEGGSVWLEELDDFLDEFGNRVVAAHLDITTSTWKEDPTPVIDTLKGYFERIERGWDFYASREAVANEREEVAESLAESLPDDETRAEFRRLLEAGRGVYAFQEDHGFYIDQGSTAALRSAVIACGRRLRSRRLIEEDEDVVHLTFSELREVMEGLARNPDVAVYHYEALIRNLVDERKEEAEEAGRVDSPLTIGNVPEKMTDPVGVKVFGIVDEILHPRHEAEPCERLEGFPGSPGSIEGPARVVTDYQEFQQVKSGEILVCQYTGTAWTPLFVKIAAVVTDTGGMLTHAAIAAREYEIPSVVGTWNATTSICDGDVIRVDGDSGVVEVLRRGDSAAAANTGKSSAG